MDEEKIICTHCGTVISDGEEFLVGDDVICEECADNETFVCEHCGQRFWNDENYGDSDTSLCRDCYRDYYVHCTHCNAIICEEDACYDDEDDRDYPYCRDCFNHYLHGKIHNYSYKPEPLFFGDGPLFMGVELEVDEGGYSNKNAAQILSIMNSCDEHAHIKSDGSLNDGMELVSHPCRLDYHLNKIPWNSAMNAYRRIG